MTAALALIVGCAAGGITALLIALVMVTFGIDSTPDWSLGVWAVWSLGWGVGAYFYLRRHPIL